MARMDHVTQIGKPQEAPTLYLEDYVYTYLKRQKDTDRKKYYLYGEKEGSREQEKLYIYGISDSSREENTYFKDYHPLGLLKVRDGERFLAMGRGQEKPITGFYVFYAPNHSMQEYLVDTSLGDKEEDRLREKPIREGVEKTFRIKEKFILPGNIIFYLGCVSALFLLAVTITGGNGYHKLSAFREMVLQTISSSAGEERQEEFVVEEQRVNQDAYPLPTISENNLIQPVPQPSSGEIPMDNQAEIIQTDVPDKNETAGEKKPDETTTVQEEDSAAEEYETYIVQEGDTLAKICKVHYGSTIRMQEICDFNEIKNEDYIAPGQKLYLPK